MANDAIPKDIRDTWEVHEWRHGFAILKQDFPEEFRDIVEVLRGFKLLRSEVSAKGGSKSPIAKRIDSSFYKRGWVEKRFDTKFSIDGKIVPSPTHGIDCFKNQVGLEVEWNNKDPFFDRDLNNFRLLFDLRAIALGIVITRCDELQQVFDELGKGASYGQATTHMGKLLPKVDGGGGGGCPLIAFGITRKLFVDDSK